MNYPPWVVLHVPHDSLEIPPSIREQFVLSDDELQAELVRMTDHHTYDLFCPANSQAEVVRAPVSRLVVDVERFEDDRNEPMAARGMGAVYTVTSGMQPLRRPLRASDRESLLRSYYWPHHAQLEAAVARAVESHGRCLVLDCHSFPSVALPYELDAADEDRPDVCIGTDSFHTSTPLAEAFMDSFEKHGWRVSLNVPFSGALVPACRYRQDPRVSAIMVEINRRLYLNEHDATKLASYQLVAQRIQRACDAAIATAFGRSH